MWQIIQCFLIDPRGDTISLHYSDEYLNFNNSTTKSTYYLWASSRAGKSFLQQFDQGGKYNKHVVSFHHDPNLNSDGLTEVFLVDKSGTKTKINEANIAKHKQSVMATLAGKEGHMEFKISTNILHTNMPPEQTPFKLGYSVTANVDAFEHEAQHVMFNVWGLKKGKKPTAFAQHKKMKQKGGSYYQTRYNLLLDIKSYWINNFNRIKNKQRETKQPVFSESEYIDYITNDFTN